MSRRSTWITIIVSMVIFLLLAMLAMDARSQDPVVSPFGRFWVLSRRIDALEERVAKLEADNTYLREQATKLIPYVSTLANATRFNSSAEMERHQYMVAQGFTIGMFYRRGDGVRVEWTAALEAQLATATARAVELHTAVGNAPDLQLPPE